MADDYPPGELLRPLTRKDAARIAATAREGATVVPPKDPADREDVYSLEVRRSILNGIAAIPDTER